VDLELQREVLLFGFVDNLYPYFIKIRGKIIPISFLFPPATGLGKKKVGRSKRTKA
jgi:hypothetical protein